jgi:hypothetical protein
MTGLETTAAVAAEALKDAAAEALKEGAKQSAEVTVKEGVQAGNEGLRGVAPETVGKDAAIEKIRDLFEYNQTIGKMEDFPKWFEGLKEKEPEKANYEHMKESIKKFFKDELGIDIKVEPLGMPRGGQVDIIGIDENGRPCVGEIKSKNEAKNNSWWSDWKDRLTSLYSEAIKDLGSKAKGWCAVVDGQLREYYETHGLKQGYLVVEDGEKFAGDIEEALNFLKKEGRIKDFELLGKDEQGNFIYRIDYA